MARVSNSVVTILNLLTLACSCLAIGYSIWLHHHPGTLCQQSIQKPLFILGFILLVISFLGIVGSCCGVSWILTFYLILMFLLIIGMICFTVFTVIVTNKCVGDSISGKGFKEYRLGDFSNWLKKYVIDKESWSHIKSCLVDVKVCSNLPKEKYVQDFDKHRLSPLQGGCCKPPRECGLEYKNATFWVEPKNGFSTRDTDCKCWSNNQKQLCFNCNSCKAGVLNNIRSEWKRLAFISIVLTIIVVLVYSIGCCALKNNRGQHKHKYYNLERAY